MLHRRLMGLSRHGGTATGIVCRISSAAVSAVVALPHGLSRSLVLGVFVAVVLIVFVIFRRAQHDLARAAHLRAAHCQS
jgi:hypothetical protein